MPVDPSARLALRHVLEGIDTLATQRPVTARIVAATEDEDTGAKELATMLAADVALAGRVTKLANSAYFGMGGRVTTLQMAVTVVGFTTVRTMATVALTDVDDESRLPEGFWTTGASLGVAAAQLAPRFAEPPADAMCLGVLAQLGSALLYRHDRDGYRQLLADEPTFTGRWREEEHRYGMSAIAVTARALEDWRFPQAMITALQRLDDPAAPPGGLLAAAYEVVSRLTVPEHQPVPIHTLTRGQVVEDAMPRVLEEVRGQAADLRRLLLGD
jgi:HD-like signal output (HDOD) protein